MEHTRTKLGSKWESSEESVVDVDEQHYQDLQYYAVLVDAGTCICAPAVVDFKDGSEEIKEDEHTEGAGMSHLTDGCLNDI